MFNFFIYSHLGPQSGFDSALGETSKKYMLKTDSKFSKKSELVVFKIFNFKFKLLYGNRIIPVLEAKHEAKNRLRQVAFVEPNLNTKSIMLSVYF